MRIALFCLDSLACNAAVRWFLTEQARQVALLGLSARPPRGPFAQRALRDFRRSGADYSAFLLFNFLLPRWRAALPGSSTLGELCRELNIPVLRIVDVNSPEIRAELRARDIDLIVSCYFEQIFDAATLSMPRLGVVNVHSSPLPNHRGPVPVLYGCLDEPPRLGVTVHRVDDGIDTGPIMAQAHHTPKPGQSVLTIMGELHRQGLALVSDLLPSLDAGTVKEAPQTGGLYEGFPKRDTMQRLRRKGGRMIGRADIAAALTTRIDP